MLAYKQIQDKDMCMVPCASDSCGRKENDGRQVLHFCIFPDIYISGGRYKIRIFYRIVIKK